MGRVSSSKALLDTAVPVLLLYLSGHRQRHRRSTGWTEVLRKGTCPGVSGQTLAILTAVLVLMPRSWRSSQALL